MKKAILFDLYDTVLKDIFFNFKQGLQWLYETCFTESCMWEEFESYTENFRPLYAKRKEDNSEVHLMRDEIEKIFEHFNVMLPENMEDVEYNLMKHMQQETLLDEVRETLVELHDKGIGMYILSNSIFTGKATERLLEEFDILNYFNRIFASADYGIRKPHTRFFQTAVDEIQKDYPGVQKKDILYVGNDYHTDVEGAVEAGLETVWYNVANEPDVKGISNYNIRGFEELMKIFFMI